MKGNFFYKRLGIRLYKVRCHKCFSQEKLGLVSDIDRTYIARIEAGIANPTIRVLNKLARALKVRLSVLLKGV